MAGTQAETHIEARGDELEVTLRGRLDGNSIAGAWRKVDEALAGGRPRRVVVEASDLEYWDGSGAALVVHLRQHSEALEIRGLRDELRQLLDLFSGQPQCEVIDRRRGLVPEIGRAADRVLTDVGELITFVGRIFAVSFHGLLNPSRIRWRDVLLVIEKAGVNAVPIVCVIGFLMGLVMAFQSAVPMQQFGVEIYVADLVAISMLKELGPLMAAVVMAGRSGSAFAAEIGTMKVNDEVSALTTMGLDPVRFLVLSRTIATVFVSPFLALFCSLAGLVGGAIVILSFGYPLVVYVEHVRGAADVLHYLSGLVKSLAFGLLVAGIGCLRGLQTKSGPTAVGDSTTRAVVSGIVLIAVTDAVFSVIFYALEI